MSTNVNELASFIYERRLQLDRFCFAVISSNCNANTATSFWAKQRQREQRQEAKQVQTIFRTRERTSSLNTRMVTAAKSLISLRVLLTDIFQCRVRTTPIIEDFRADQIPTILSRP
jgi:hypothetical protein